MKYLFNSAFKAIRKGPYVIADDKRGEFIHDDEASTLAAAQITEIATANKLEIAKNLKKNEAVEKLNELLAGMKLDEVNRKPDTTIVEEICAAGHKANKSDDEMLIEIVSAGVKFSIAGKLFKQVMEAKGYRVSNKERMEKAAELLEASELKTPEEVQEMVAALAADIPDTSEKQAMSLVKKFAKTKNIELPEIKKAAAAGRGGIRQQAYDWMIKNPTAESASLQKWLEERGKKANVVKRMVDIFETAKKVAEALNKATA